MTNLPPSHANLRGAVDLSSLVRPPASSGQAPAVPVGGSRLVVEGTDATFTSILDLSQSVPVIVELYVGAPSTTLVRVITEYAGKFVLATVEATGNPQLQQAFQAAAAPTVAAVIAGRPVALYEGDVPEEDVRTVLEQVLKLAAQNNVTGTIPVEVDADTANAGPAEPVEVPLPPHHQEAYDAISVGDYETAIKEYKTAIAQDPRDQLAVAGLAQVSLLARIGTASAAEIRSAAAENPTDLDAQLGVADLDVSGGHLDDAFLRLLDLFPSLDQPGKERVRTRMLDYFEIAGVDDPRVVAARRQLTGLLY